MGKRANSLGVVSIIGPGLIGGSIGLGLRRKGLARAVIGVGHRRVSLRKAVKLGAIDWATLDVKKGVRDADIVILCTSVGLIPEMAARAIPAMKSGAILTDVGSTKRRIVESIESITSDGITFVGGHPIAGSEHRGIEAARHDLFKGHTCILTPTNRTPALQKIKSLWRGLGSKVLIMSPDEHDQILASISHLPLLLAATLVNATSTKKLRYAGPGFRDVTRIASSNPMLWRDILQQNRREVLKALSSFQKELGSLKSMMQKEGPEKLLAWLMRAKRLRDAIVNSHNNS